MRVVSISSPIFPHFVIPANAGICLTSTRFPAFAGMTDGWEALTLLPHQHVVHIHVP